MAKQPRATNATVRLTLGRQLASLAAFMFLIAAGARAQQTNVAALGSSRPRTQVRRRRACVRPRKQPDRTPYTCSLAVPW